MPKLVPIHYEKLIKVFKLEGFQIVRKRGDHILMTKPGIKRPLVIKSSLREFLLPIFKPTSILPKYRAKIL